MSAETKAALDAAIEAHVLDAAEDGAVLTGYLLEAQYSTIELADDYMTGYVGAVYPGQSFTTNFGLAAKLYRYFAAKAVGP